MGCCAWSSTNYNLRFRESGSDTWTTSTYLPSNVRTIYNLDSDVTYEFAVQSSCDGNNSNLSAWASNGKQPLPQQVVQLQQIFM